MKGTQVYNSRSLCGSVFWNNHSTKEREPMTTKKTEPEDSPELVQAVKKPRRVNTAINNLIEQRKKAIAVRDKAADEVKQYDAALLALGWLE